MSTYSSLKFELILTGDQSGQWGNTTNANIGTAIEQAIVGMATLTSANFPGNIATLALADTNAAQNARALCLNIDSAALSAAGTINVPAIQKPYIIINGSSQAVTVKVSGLTGVTVPSGKRTVVYNNGTDVGNQIDYLATLALGTALPATSGGSGQSSYAVGDLLYANTTTTLAKLADVVTGNALISGGVTTAPTWGKIGLTTHVSGTLAATNGGTGANTTTTGDLLYGSASDTWTKLAGNTTATRKYLVSVGSGSAATAPEWDQIDIGTTDITGTLAATNGGTGTATVTTGDILYGGTTSNTWAKLAAGTAGQLLQTNGAAAPSWVNAPTFTGVSSFDGGSTGLTPSSASTGAITLAGTLAVANGGTGVTTSTGTGSVVLSIAPTFTGSVNHNISAFTTYTFYAASQQTRTAPVGINLATSTDYLGTSGASTASLFGLVSSPATSNSGASGNLGNNIHGVYSAPQINTTGASTVAGVAVGGFFTVDRNNPGDNGTYNAMYGVYGRASILNDTGIAKAGSMYGVSGYAEHSGNSTVTEMFGGYFDSNQASGGIGVVTGTIAGVYARGRMGTVASTNLYGVQATVVAGQSTLTTLTQPSAAIFDGSATIGNIGTITCTNFYGLRLRTPTINAGASITNHYGVYQEASSAQNYFAGGLTVQGLTVGKGPNALATNTAFGVSALANVGSFGNVNTAIGNEAGASNIDADNNVYVGHRAGYSNQNGSNNTYIGSAAGITGITSKNTAVGYLALGSNYNFDENTAVGYLAGYYGTGAQQTAIGNNTGGLSTYTGSNLTLLGYQAAPSTTAVSNQITLGNNSVTSLRCNVTTITALSDARDKYDIEDLPIGLDFINSLRPRRFKWDRRDAYFDQVEIKGELPSRVAVPKDGSRKLTEWNEGFIAQEADEAATAANADWLKLVYKENPEKLEMAPGKLIPVLVKAIQELTARLEALEARN